MKHIAVLQKEVITYLAPRPNQNIIDATLGHGGHAKMILEKIAPNGKLLGIDQDDEALQVAEKYLEEYQDRLQVVHNNFQELGLIVRKWDVSRIDGILIDLGPNTDQLTSDSRGFSFMHDAPLDMRMDRLRNQLTAKEIVNKYQMGELVKIFYAGEEKFARQIAAKILEYRKKKTIETTGELQSIVESAVPAAYRYSSKTNIATSTFRSLRIAVNNELDNLESVLLQAQSILSPGGRIAIISFHSLEDRIVKNFLRDSDKLEVLTPKPIIAGEDEVATNPPSRSAKLRVAQKLM